MTQRMSLLVLRNRFVAGDGEAGVAVLRVAGGVKRIAIVGVDDVASRAARRAVIAGVIVRAEEREMRIVEPRLVQIDERGRDAQAGAAVAIAESDVGLSCLPFWRRIPNIGERARAGDPAAFEGAEVLGGLKDLPARQRNENRQRALRDLFGSRRRRGLDRGGVAGAVVTLAEQSLLASQQSVRVADGGPEDGGRGHRAARNGIDLALMTAAARFRRDAKVAGIDELDELRRLTK